MPFVHVHHCPSPSTTVSPAVIAIAGATAARASNDDVDTECSIWCSCCGYLRYLLVFLALLGCGIDYMLRFNISVAIVAMVNNSVANDVIHVNSSYACPAARNASRDAQGTTGAGEYNWTAQEQSLVLGTFFWGYAITKTVGGRIAELLGATFTVAITVGLCGVLTLLTPTVADIHPLALAALRFVFGMLQGPIQPAIYSILSRWALPGERATMISVAFSGSCLGSLVSLGLSGAVIKAYGWRWVFWGYGILTMLWVPFWAIYVKDSPRQHPAISSRELRQLSKNRNQPRRKVPWSRILKSRHIYLFIMMEFVTVWLQGILMAEGPTYMSSQVGMDLDTLGTVNIVLMTLTWVVTLLYGRLSDLFEKRQWLSVTNIRRIAQSFGMVMTAVSTIGLSLVGCDGTLVAVFLVLMAIGAPVVYVTYTMGPMDIAPNYAGTLCGLYGVGTVSGFLSPMFVSLFVDKKNGWPIIFWVTGGLFTLASVVYIIFVSGEEVEWNIYEEIPGDSHASAVEKEIEGQNTTTTPQSQKQK